MIINMWCLRSINSCNSFSKFNFTNLVRVVMQHGSNLLNEGTQNLCYVSLMTRDSQNLRPPKRSLQVYHKDFKKMQPSECAANNGEL